MHEEQQYLNLLRKILSEGVERPDRTGVGTKSIFGAQMRFDISEQFPLLTTKRVWFKGVVHELLWILSGSTNTKYLKDNSVHIWDAWDRKKEGDSGEPIGDLGKIYGHQWRRWLATDLVEPDSDKAVEGWHSLHNSDGSPRDVDSVWEIDQISNVINSIKKNPYSRRHIVTAWNPADINQMALPPCHCFFQFYVAEGRLSCQLFQRSVDSFLGAPFNIASYSLLTYMIAQVTGLKPGAFIYTLGDAHIYNNHVDQVLQQLNRLPYEFPKVYLNNAVKNIDDFVYEDVSLVDYKCHATIKAPIAV